LNLLAAPMAAAGVVTRMFPACGWDVEQVRQTMQAMLFGWGQIAGVLHPDAAAPAAGR
jgi:hypothetical protein